MAVTYGFYDSLNHDRLYNAKQMSAIFDGIINDGVFDSVGNQLHTVAGSGMQVIVKSGRAWFNSTWTLNDAEYPLTIDAADVLLTRIDAVVIEVNSEQATRANSIKVVKGTPASSPAKPTLTNTSTVHQHALAYVTIAKNTTAITNSMIEIVVGKTETPYVTAILQTTDITDLYKQWEDQFKVWFETVKGTLDGDVALNLQNQIDHCVKKADKATAADIEAGTADKWVDSKTLKDDKLSIGTIRFSIEENVNNGIMCTGSYIPEDADLLSAYNPTNSNLKFNIYDSEKIIPEKILNRIGKSSATLFMSYYNKEQYVYITRANNLNSSSMNLAFVTYKYNRLTGELSDAASTQDTLSRSYTGSTYLHRDGDIIIYIHSIDSNNHICFYAYNVVTNKLIVKTITDFKTLTDIRSYIIRYGENKTLVIICSAVANSSMCNMCALILNWTSLSCVIPSSQTALSLSWSNLTLIIDKKDNTSVYLSYYIYDRTSISCGTMTGFDMSNETLSDTLTLKTTNISLNVRSHLWYFAPRYLTYNNNRYITSIRGLISIDQSNGNGTVVRYVSDSLNSNVPPPIAIIEYNNVNIAIGYLNEFSDSPLSSIYILPSNFFTANGLALYTSNVTSLIASNDPINLTARTHLGALEDIKKSQYSNNIIMGPYIIGIDSPIINQYAFLMYK